MLDFSRLEQYHENNRIEAKKALGGLPHSIWETYSAFANTLGGIILLGVEEYRDKSLHTVDLPDPEKLIREFWAQVNQPEKASVNVLTGKDVRVETVDGDHIIVITVPPAQRVDRPVYVGGSLLSGSYRRNGEGDYRCGREEIFSMVRDALTRSPDMLILEEMDLSVFHAESVHGYRRRMEQARPGHAWEGLEDEPFLKAIGAVGLGADGNLHPTGAGLLLFGNERDIVREYPSYFLDYQAYAGDPARLTGRLVSSSGDWSGNLYDFFDRACQALTRDIRADGPDAPVRGAIREALANCIVNADYYGQQGLVVIQSDAGITFSNPGGFRVGVDVAKSGGVSDPRNGALHKMFSLIDVSEGTGRGIPHILRVWHDRGWPEPEITERFDPPRTTLSLSMKPLDPKAAKPANQKAPLKTAMSGDLIVEYLTDHATAKSGEIAALLGVKTATARQLLNELVSDGIVVTEGAAHDPVYKLKA